MQAFLHPLLVCRLALYEGLRLRPEKFLLREPVLAERIQYRAQGQAQVEESGEEG